MSKKNYSGVVEKAREYYNSDDADKFYYDVWGGEDIHIGLYEGPDHPIRDASQKTVEKMDSCIQNIGKDSKVLDAGAGFGGAARYLAKKYGCQVVALNLSEKQNERDRQMNKEQGLDHLIDVVDGDFENLSYDDETFDVVWSEDSFLHSGNGEKVMQELHRVLKKGGELIFTDPMQSPDAKQEDLQPVLDRIHLETMGSFKFYEEQAKKLGMETVQIIDLSHQLPEHYSRVAAELKEKTAKMNHISQEYVDRMLKGLSHWVEAGRKGALNWGILHFKKK